MGFWDDQKAANDARAAAGAGLPTGDDYWAERLNIAKATLMAYDNAIQALSSGQQSYQLNTGQSTQMVTKVNLASLRDTRQTLMNEVAVLEQRLNGCATTHMIPGF